MSTILSTTLAAVGIPYKARFSLDEVAQVLAITREQVVDLLKKQRLTGFKSSPGRWRWVFGEDLGSYLEAINVHSSRNREPQERAPESDDFARRNDEEVNAGPSSNHVIPDELGEEEIKAVRRFVDRLGYLPTLDYTILRISSKDLIAFYHAFTSLERQDHAPIFLALLRDAIKRNDGVMWEVGPDPVTGEPVFGGVDLETLCEFFNFPIN